jgi:hypothetical protein
MSGFTDHCSVAELNDTYAVLAPGKVFDAAPAAPIHANVASQTLKTNKCFNKCSN